MPFEETELSRLLARPCAAKNQQPGEDRRPGEVETDAFVRVKRQVCRGTPSKHSAFTCTLPFEERELSGPRPSVRGKESANKPREDLWNKGTLALVRH